MDRNRPRPPRNQGPQPSDKKYGQDMFVQQYVQAARERLYAINASLPATNTSSTEHVPQPAEAVLPPQAAAEYAKNPSSSTQWPLKPQDQEQPLRGLQSQPQPETLQEAKPQRPLRHPDRPSYGYTPTQTPGRPREQAESPKLPSSIPRATPPAQRGGPAPRGGYRGQATRHPAGPPRAPPPPHRQYYPPPNVAPSQPFAQPAPQQRARNPPAPAPAPAPSSGRLSAAQLAPPQNIPMIREESDSRQSAHSSVLTGNSIDVLSEYYSDDASSDVRPGNPAGNANDPNASPPQPANHVTGIVRQASVGHVQKPVITSISSPTRADGSSTADQDTTVSNQVSPITPSAESREMIASNARSTNMPVIQAPAGTTKSHQVQPVSPSTPAPAKPSPVLASTPVLASPAASHSTLNTKRSRSPLLPIDSKFTGSPTKPALKKQGSRELLSQSETESPKDLGDSALSSPTQASASNSGGIRDSTTSLRGLIVRNLRLASNLEQGKTSSRFGIDWMISEHAEGRLKSAGSGESIIDPFPTSPRGEKSRSMAEDEHGFPRAKGGQSTANFEDDRKNREQNRAQRRCCGMPFWLFIVLIVLIIILIAAAIIIPVALIVIPNQNQPSPSPSPSPTPIQADSGCVQSMQCHNGGSAQLSANGACYCLCVNPWTGPSCGTRDAASCTSTQFQGESNAAIGSSIVPLVKSSQSRFGIQLDSSALIGLFGKFNMTCSSENDLVSFDGIGSNRATLKPRKLLSMVKVARATKVQPRQETSNGIIYAPTTTMASYIPSPTGVAPSGTPANGGSSTQAIDFARTATLYILQFTSKLHTAQTAQSKLEGYLNTALADGSVYSGNAVNIGNGWRADFTSWTVYYSGL